MNTLSKSRKGGLLSLTKSAMPHVRLLSTTMLTLIGIVTSVSLVAADSLVDKFDGERLVLDRAETSRIEVLDGKLIVTARETESGVWGKYGNKAVFGWTPEGAGAAEGFSIDPADEQFVLQIKNMEKVTPDDKSESSGLTVYIYFYVFGSQTRLAESGEIPALAVPTSGSWSFDVRAFAIGRFGGEDKLPKDLIWRPEFYISTENQEGVGYSFESIGAVNSLD